MNIRVIKALLEYAAAKKQSQQTHERLYPLNKSGTFNRSSLILPSF